MERDEGTATGRIHYSVAYHKLYKEEQESKEKAAAAQSYKSPTQTTTGYNYYSPEYTKQLGYATEIKRGHPVVYWEPA